MLEPLVIQMRAAVRQRLGDAERKQRCARTADEADGGNSPSGHILRRDALHDIAVAGQFIRIIGMLEDERP